jgi:hypothetical protein
MHAEEVAVRRRPRTEDHIVRSVGKASKPKNLSPKSSPPVDSSESGPAHGGTHPSWKDTGVSSPRIPHGRPFPSIGTVPDVISERGDLFCFQRDDGRKLDVRNIEYDRSLRTEVMRIFRFRISSRFFGSTPVDLVVDEGGEY